VIQIRQLIASEAFYAALATCVLIASLLGCRGGGSNAAEVDRPLARQSRQAVEAFHYGYDNEAIEHYRLALRRAWELDDAEAIANTAYNLAACWAAMQQFEPARQALAEARAELRRSGQSEVDAWLLEAKIARAQGRLGDAAYYADCVLPPMIRRDPACNDSCRKEEESRLLAMLRGCRQRIATCLGHGDDEPDVCEGYNVSLAVFRANLALDSGDVPGANASIARAKQWDTAQNNPAARAEVAAAEARLLLMSQRPEEAAQRLDEETHWLRQSGHLRELPMATSSAAEAFLQAGQPLEASVRFFRTARLLYGRGDLLAALFFLEQSISLAVEMNDADLQLRAALLLEEIERANRKRKSPDAVKPEEIDAVRSSSESASTGTLEPLPLPTTPPDAESGL
jgi:tetratricopeptide (TPR) repeat protein